MAKFSGSRSTPVKANLKAPITATRKSKTYEGAKAFKRTDESDLFLLACTNMVSEETYYESAEKRDERFVKLIHTVTKHNPTFIAGDASRVGLASYLRNDMFMRSASIVLAAEYLAAGGPSPRQVVSAVLQRADEPAEMIGYWHSHFGRNLPMPLKRGIADALPRLYTERNLLKYDGINNPIRFADVIEMTHPRPQTALQSSLYDYGLDRRHRETIPPESLTMLTNAYNLDRVPENKRRALLRKKGFDLLTEAGYTWEHLSSWLPGGMDTEAWEAIIPSMKVMALIRNLRNFDKVNIQDKIIDQVINKITDPEQVAQARLFPYQIWTAYKNAPSDNWKRALGKTLGLTTQNIPELNGSLVLIDVSGSMSCSVSMKSTVTMAEIGAVMGVTTAQRSKDTDVVVFASTNQKMEITPGTSTLKTVEAIANLAGHGRLGSGTNGFAAMNRYYDSKKHKRVVFFTDGQFHDSNPVKVPMTYLFNLAGYDRTPIKSGSDGRYELGGFSDSTFTMMKVLEAGRDAHWPF